MKTFHKPILLLASVLASFTGCTNDTTEDRQTDNTVEGIKIEFAIAGESERSSLSEDETTIAFNDGDKIGVYVDNATTPTINAEGTVSHVDGVAVVSFTAQAFEPGDRVMAYYPYTAANDGVSYDKAVITVPHTQVQNEAGVFNGENMPMVSVATTLDSTEGAVVLFRPAGAILKLNIFSSGAEYHGAKILSTSFYSAKWTGLEAATGSNWCVGKLATDLGSITESDDISIAKNTIKAVSGTDYLYVGYTMLDNAATVSGEKQSIYLAVWPGNYGSYNTDAQTSYIYVQTDKGRFRFNLPDNAADGGYEFARAMIRPFALDLSSETAIKSDLPSVEQIREDADTDGVGYASYLADELVVTSDCENPNMERNTQTGWKTTPYEDNYRTAYAQTLDGKYGFRLVFDNASDNTLHRGDKLNLFLYGATVRKEENPTRYVIEHLSPKNIMLRETGHTDLIPNKERTIATLTDDDVYTYTTLTDMEFVVKDGAYTYGIESMMATTSNAIRDNLATMLQDADNNAIYTLINSKCAWRRDDATGKTVPKGVGRVSGIIVHTEDPAYGDMGRYQIRPLDESSFDIPAEEAYANNVLARWSLTKATISIGQYAWNGSASGGFLQGNATTMRQNKMHATHGLTDGSAVLYTTNLNIINGTTTGHPTIVGGSATTMNNFSYQPSIINGTKGVTDLNTDTAEGKVADLHGQSKASALVFRHDVAGYYEWNESGDWTGNTNGIVIEFPATSVSSQMSVSFTTSAMQVGITNNLNVSTKHMYKGLTHTFPLYWKVECSTDNGQTWQLCTNTINGSQEFEMRSVVNWLNAQSLTNPVTGQEISAYSPLAMPAGFIQEKFTLPESASGAANVMVKISPKSLRLAWFGSEYTDSIDTGIDCTSDLKYPSALMLEDVAITY